MIQTPDPQYGTVTDGTRRHWLKYGDGALTWCGLSNADQPDSARLTMCRNCVNTQSAEAKRQRARRRLLDG